MQTKYLIAGDDYVPSNDPTKLGTGACVDRNCGVRNVASNLMRTFTIPAAESCGMIELRLDVKTRVFRNYLENSFIKFKLKNNNLVSPQSATAS